MMNSPVGGSGAQAARQRWQGFSPASEFAAFDVVTLPSPRMDRNIALMQALRRRHSTRAFSDRPVAIEDLSDLLWCALGINRDSGDRTVPFWRHVHAIDLYVALPQGVWLYEPRLHQLQPYLATDIRARTGLQEFVGTAPIELVYVARGADMGDVSDTDRRLFASVDSAFMGENVYLFCAAAGLATVFRGALDSAALGHVLMLPPRQFVTFAQSVGYAADAS